MAARPKRCHRSRKHRRLAGFDRRLTSYGSYSSPRTDMHSKLTAAIVAVLLLVIGGYMMSKYIEFIQKQQALKLKNEYDFREMEVRSTVAKECRAKCIDEIYELKQNISLKEIQIAHAEKMHQITSAYSQDTELRKLRIRKEAELKMADLQLTMEAEVNKELIKSQKELEELGLINSHKEQMEKIRLLAEKDLEFKVQMEDLKLQRDLESKRIEVARDTYMRLLQPVIIRRKKKSFFGFSSSEYEEVQWPRIDTAVIRELQQAMQPQLT